jgi:hypothetical protein
MRRTIGLVVGLVLAAGVPAATGSTASSSTGHSIVIAVVGEAGANVLHREFRSSTAPVPPGAPAPVEVRLPADGPFDARLKLAQASELGHVRPGGLLRLDGTRLLIKNVDAEPHDVLADPEHGTGVLGSMAGRTTGSAPGLTYVLVLGDLAESFGWVARQPWIDLVTVSRFGVGGKDPACPAGPQARAVVSAGKPVFAAGGNQTAVELATSPTGLPEVIRVGGVKEDGSPDELATKPYEIGDQFLSRFPSWTDDRAMVAEYGTSFASPRAAGRAGLLVAAARRFVGDRGTGVRGGRLVVAPAGAGLPSTGPLSDGALSSAELRQLLQDTATPSLPDATTRYAAEGFGALGTAQTQLALRVLRGQAAAPDRTPERRLFEAHQAAAGVTMTSARCG